MIRTRNMRNVFFVLFWTCMALVLRADYPTTYQTEDYALHPSNLIGHQFGATVKQDGEWLMVYAEDREFGSEDAGAIFVYRKVDGAWTFFQKIKTSNHVMYTYFGQDFALNGNELFAIYRVSSTEIYGYCYRFDGTQWAFNHSTVVEPSTYTPMSPQIAMTRSRVFVPILYPMNGEPPHVSIYEKVDGQWTVAQKVYAPLQGMSSFGLGVAASEGVFATAGATSDGYKRVYVFREQDGQWSLEAELAASDEENDDTVCNYGARLAMQGDTLVVSNMSRNVSNAIAAGAVYVYQNSLGQWAETQKIENPGPYSLSSEWFGYSLAIKGNLIAIGAVSDTLPGSSYRSGSVYVCRNNAQAGVWEGLAWFGPSNINYYMDYGIQVVIEGRDVVVGARNAVVDGTPRGEVYVHQLPLPAPSLDEALLYGSYAQPEGVIRASLGGGSDATGSTFILERLFGNIWGEVDREFASSNSVPELVDESKWALREPKYVYRVRYLTDGGDMSPYSAEITATPAADLDQDDDVDEVDEKLFKECMGLTHKDPHWNPRADLVRDGEINKLDAEAFKTWLSSHGPLITESQYLESFVK